MSEDMHEKRFGKKEDSEEDAVYNIESYSEESGEPDIDPFSGHYGKLTR